MKELFKTYILIMTLFSILVMPSGVHAVTNASYVKLQKENKLLKAQLAQLKEQTLSCKTDKLGQTSSTTPLNEKKVLVSVKWVNTFSPDIGINQTPAFVAYKIENTSNVDIPIDSITFSVETKGQEYSIGYRETLYSFSTKERNKNNAFYLPVDNVTNPVTHEFEESIIIPANSTKVLYLNMWGFSGGLAALRFGGAGSTVITLHSLKSLKQGTVFDLGADGKLIAIDYHKQGSL